MCRLRADSGCGLLGHPEPLACIIRIYFLSAPYPRVSYHSGPIHYLSVILS